MTPPDPIQAQLITARRNQILDAATRVFAEKGFHKATIKAVAKDAGIADGTIYIYFDNKMALLLGILDRVNESSERESHFAEADIQDIEAWSRTYIKHRLETIAPVEPVLRAILPEVLTNRELASQYLSTIIEPAFDIAGRYYQKLREAGITENHDPALVARAVSGMILGLLMLRLIGDEPLLTRWDELPDLITKMVLNGILKRDSHE